MPAAKVPAKAKAPLDWRQHGGAHISLGSMKYAAGAVVTRLLAEKIKTPEQRYLVLAAVRALMGAVSTAWGDSCTGAGGVSTRAITSLRSWREPRRRVIMPHQQKRISAHIGP